MKKVTLNSLAVTVDSLAVTVNSLATTVDSLVAAIKTLATKTDLDALAAKTDSLTTKTDLLARRMVSLEEKTDTLATKTDLDTLSERVDSLAIMTQEGFLAMENKMATKEDLAAARGEIGVTQEGIFSLSKHVYQLEEKVENGFYAFHEELKEIRGSFRTDIRDLQKRTHRIEKKLQIS